MHAGGDDHDARWRIGEQARQEQVGEEEVAQMVHGERELEPIGRVTRSLRHLEPGIADEGAERHVLARDLPGEPAHRGDGTEIETHLGGRVVAALVGDSPHGVCRHLTIPARDQHVPALARELARTLETDARVPTGHESGITIHEASPATSAPAVRSCGVLG